MTDMLVRRGNFEYLSCDDTLTGTKGQQYRAIQEKIAMGWQRQKQSNTCTTKGTPKNTSKGKKLEEARKNSSLHPLERVWTYSLISAFSLQNCQTISFRCKPSSHGALLQHFQEANTEPKQPSWIMSQLITAVRTAREKGPGASMTSWSRVLDYLSVEFLHDRKTNFNLEATVIWSFYYS